MAWNLDDESENFNLNGLGPRGVLAGLRYRWADLP